MDIKQRERYLSNFEKQLKKAENANKSIIEKSIQNYNSKREYIASENLIAGQLAIIDQRSGFLKSARLQDPSDQCIKVMENIWADSIAVVKGDEAYAHMVPSFQKSQEYEYSQSNGTQYQEMNPHPDALDLSILSSESETDNSVNALCKKAFEISKSKGFYDNSDSKVSNKPNERNFGEFVALVHSELSEALEHERKGRRDVFLEGTNILCTNDAPDETFEAIEQASIDLNGKPDGTLIELADAVIRIFDYCGSRSWNLEGAIKLKMAFNETRPYKHGKEF